MKKNKLQEMHGITLIALIVTIIVLLILAGVTLSLILGGEGILGKATNAVDISNKVQIKEDVELLLTDIKAEYYLSEERGTTNFREYVESQVKASSGGLKTPNEGYLKWDEEGPFYEDKNGNQYEIEISEEGKVTVGGPISSNPSTDTNPPTVKIDATTSNSITFTMSDGRGSGVKAYAVIEGTNAPSESDWIEVTGAPKTVTQTVTGKQNEKTYYVWAKDVAGNVTNTGTEAITKAIDAASSSNTDYTITWSGTNATVSFTTTTGYKIQLSTNNSSFETKNSITVPSGTTIYVRLTDETSSGTSYQAVTVVWQGTVTYNANGGIGGPSQQKANHGDSVQVSFSPLPTRAGCQFLGWAKDNANATTANFTSSGTKTFTMETANVTLYAVWEELKYPVVSKQGVWKPSSYESDALTLDDSNVSSVLRIETEGSGSQRNLRWIYLDNSDRDRNFKFEVKLEEPDSGFSIQYWREPDTVEPAYIVAKERDIFGIDFAGEHCRW